MTHWTKDSGDGLPTHPVFLHHPQPTLHEVHYASHVAALEDKIVQRAVTALLNEIYEEDFLGFSYGFRPGRSAHATKGINGNKGDPFGSNASL